VVGWSFGSNLGFGVVWGTRHWVVGKSVAVLRANVCRIDWREVLNTTSLRSIDLWAVRVRGTRAREVQCLYTVDWATLS